MRHLADPVKGKTSGHMKFRFRLDSKRWSVSDVKSLATWNGTDIASR